MMADAEAKIVVIAEYFENHVSPVTYELIAFSRLLQNSSSMPVVVIVLGRDVRQIAERISAATGFSVKGIEGEHLEPYNGEIYKTVLRSVLSEINPKYVCIAHTSRGYDFAPGVAVQMKASCITGVEGLHDQDGVLTFVRSIFKEKLKVEVMPSAPRVVLTILPGMFKAAEEKAGLGGSFDIIKTVFSSDRVRSMGLVVSAEEFSDLSEAEVIVSAGKGIGNHENLELIQKLAALFQKSAIGGSRAVCDIGWLGYKHQIGMTGKTVAPKLYIACGISGSAQHTYGMRQSQCIVAINTDPQAPIFRIADYGVVEDLTTFIPVILETRRKQQNV
jgi:electron transfer flavoprotein alpha subunit